MPNTNSLLHWLCMRYDYVYWPPNVVVLLPISPLIAYLFYTFGFKCRNSRQLKCPKMICGDADILGWGPVLSLHLGL